MIDHCVTRRNWEKFRSPLMAGVCLACLIVGAHAQDANSKPDQSQEFVETPVGATPVAGASSSPAEFVETPVGVSMPAVAAIPGASQATATAPPNPALNPFGFLNTAQRSSNLLGDMWGLRPLLAKYGTTLNIVENSEVLGNVTGGFRQGFSYEGLTTATLQMDTQRAFGVQGGTFNVSAEQIHGGNLSAANLGTLQTASGIEADPTTRLWELWYQQKFGDKFDV
ncbi:MAG: carbohydrate porin, partial [Hyphomicrobiales bacterium]|nr:carbohydrate porin [Hyphomicrobiales bacterium]